MNILHVVYCWLKIRQQPDQVYHPRTFFFGGKAAPSYTTAKLIIRLICHIGEMINRDTHDRKADQGRFPSQLPGVSWLKKIFRHPMCPSDINGRLLEAYGTSNMKFALNGALTVGTLDGANVEIQEEVGPENIFIFELNAMKFPGTARLQPDETSMKGNRS